jgi:hypothetical protein
MMMIKQRRELTRRLLKRSSRWIGRRSTAILAASVNDRIIIDRLREDRRGIDKIVDRSALLRELWSLHRLIPRCHTFGDLDSQVNYSTSHIVVVDSQ